ncbi:Hap2-elong multi-domain protein [Pyrenophora teres f. maculata]|nr:Hap2-elong multi-domain protein [Pyrenophora teres f. maculata]
MTFEYNPPDEWSEFDWNVVTLEKNFLLDVYAQHVKIADGLQDFQDAYLLEALLNDRPKSTRARRPRNGSSVNKTRSVRDNSINYNLGGSRRRPLVQDRIDVPMASRSATLAQYERHSVQLMSRVLNIRHNASPFTLVLDDLNQRAFPFVDEMIRRALSRNIDIVVVTFETTHYAPPLRQVNGYNATAKEIMQDLRKAMDGAKESLVIVDSLNDMLNEKRVDMGELFNLVAGTYSSTLVGVYHCDMLPTQDARPETAYAPEPLELVKYMATSVITCKSFAHCLAAKAAKERSLPEPTHGLLQGAEGVIECLKANDNRGIVLEAEFRRKSGRPEGETFFLPAWSEDHYRDPLPSQECGTLKQEIVVLLDKVPEYATPKVVGQVDAAGNEIESTFNLGLTDKQKQAREGVVLPYFDAQKGEGGEGGRILYDMGSEDDFDEEEDEF